MKNIKIYEAYKPKADLLMNYQLCRAYFNQPASIVQVVEKILSEAYPDLTDGERAKIRDCQGKRNAVIEFRAREFKSTVYDILSEYVRKRFDKMVAELLASKPNYPLTFRDIVEKFL